MDNKPPFSGTVKEYSLKNYLCDEKGKEHLDYKYVWKYNPDHQISEIQHYSSRNVLSDISYHSYDDRRNLLEITVKTAKGTKKQQLVYEYKDHQLSQITDITRNFRIVTQYDDHGNPIEKQNLSSAGTLLSTTKYINQYDQNHRLVEKRTFFSSENSDWIDKFQYNEQGCLVEETRIRHQAVSTVKYDYNEKGDLILGEYNPGEINREILKKDIVYSDNNDILEIKEYRRGWCYSNYNDNFGLTGIARYSYVR